MLSVENLKKTFGSFTAVEDISIEVEPGEIFSFLGTNGAGKTTTIKMITGCIKPTSGNAYIGGFDINKNPIEAKKLLGVIPDRPTLYEKLSGREFLDFIASIHQISSKQKRINYLLEKYELIDKADTLIENFSHGMKQRLMLCSAQIHSPTLLVIDEPTVGLDPMGTNHLKQALKDLASEGTAIFMSTHSLNFAQEISDKVAIIKTGNIIAKGSLEEIFNKTEKLKNGTDSLESTFLDLIKNDSLLTES